jgi:hypothetical protein
MASDPSSVLLFKEADDAFKLCGPFRSGKLHRWHCNRNIIGRKALHGSLLSEYLLSANLT